MSHKEVASVMTPADRVVSVELGTRCADIARLLSEHRISAVPVVDAESRVLGVVSEADILSRGARSFGSGSGRLGGATALDVMTAPAVTVGVAEDVDRAARIMVERRVKRLVVTDRQERLAGVVSRRDVLEYLARSDEDVRADIAGDRLLRTLGLDPAALEVEVNEGVVRLGGRVPSRNLAELAVLVVRRLDGVTGVVDELEYDRDDSTTWP